MTHPTEPATGDQPYDPPAPQQPHTPPVPYQSAPIQQQPYVIAVRAAPTSGMAVTSLVLGIVGLVSSCCTFGIFSILAVVFGHLALAETKNGEKDGHGMAVAGLIMGYIVFVPALIFSIFVVFGAGLSALGVGSSQ